MDKDRRTEQKTWQVYNFGKRNVFRFDLNESREYVCVLTQLVGKRYPFKAVL